MKRRQFLRHGAAGACLALGGRLYAAPADAPRFLLVFLRGGYDCNNLLVPYSSDFYYESRPTLAIARPDANLADAALRLDADWGLAPALRDTIAPMFARREIAFVPFAGSDDLSRSHFETQDSIEAGLPLDGRHDFRSGFLARLAGELSGAAPMAFTDTLPLVFQGPADVPNLALRGSLQAHVDPHQAELLASMYAGRAEHAAVVEGLRLRAEVAEEFAADATNPSRGAINARGFEQEAERIGTLMRERYRLGFVDVGGWDTHVNQGGAQGTLANNLAGLGRGLDAYRQSLGERWRDTVVVVVSEFGRTFRENGNKGTDHGHGSVYWVLGGGVRGGRIAGERVEVARPRLLQDRDYPVLNDYRGLLGGLFVRLWGLSPERVQRVFPDSAPRDLALV